MFVATVELLASMHNTLTRIVSGGQTGVDRAALDVGMQWGLPIGGWCPRGRKAEDGPIPARYPLRETESAKYDVRTRRNVRDSDGTLILTAGDPVGGTALTASYAEKIGKPLLVVDLDMHPAPQPVRDWVTLHGIEVLNVAGPRESTLSGIGARSKAFFETVLEGWIARPEKRRGALRRDEIPPEILDQLNAGTLETATLAEGLAIDFRMLLTSAFGDLTIPEESDMSGDVGVTKRMQRCGEVLYAALGLDGLERIAGHPSDTVRGWAAFVIASEETLSLARRLTLVRPLADDDHFGVREWAWLALRPYLAEDVDASVRTLRPWTRRRSENLRRFAVEATRPRGVWCAHISELKEDPNLGLPLLEPLRADPARYVQDSVANWLNDAAKSQPEWVRALCERWQRESPSPATERICKRGMRSLG